VVLSLLLQIYFIIALQASPGGVWRVPAVTWEGFSASGLGQLSPGVTYCPGPTQHRYRECLSSTDFALPLLFFFLLKEVKAAWDNVWSCWVVPRGFSL